MKSKRMVLKFMAMLMAVCTLAQMSGVSFAESAGRFTEIIVKEDVDAQKAKAIADFING